MQYAILIYGAHKFKKKALSTRAFNTLPGVAAAPTQEFFHALNLIGKTKKRAWMIDFVERMKELQVPRDQSIYNTLITSHLRKGSHTKAWEFVEAMEKDGLFPDLRTLNILLDRSSSDHSIAKTLELMKVMKDEHKVQLDLVTYNTLIKLAFRRDDLERAKAAYAQIEQQGLKPDAITLTHMLKAYKHLEKKVHGKTSALALADEFQTKHGIELNLAHYNLLVDTCVRHNDIPKAKELVTLLTLTTSPPPKKTPLLTLNMSIFRFKQ